MVGIIIFLFILILLGIGIYYLYKEGYFPMTKPHFEKSKKVVDEILKKIEEKLNNPGPDLRTDVKFLDKKINDIGNIIMLSSKIKDYIKDEKKADLSYYITKLLNYHTADLDISLICDNSISEGQLAIRAPGYYNVIKNSFDINKYFSFDNELFDSCFHITSNRLESEEEESCYNQIKNTNPGINICSIEILNALLNPFHRIEMVPLR